MTTELKIIEVTRFKKNLSLPLIGVDKDHTRISKLCEANSGEYINRVDFWCNGPVRGCSPRLVTVTVEKDQINTPTCSPGAFIRHNETTATTIITHEKHAI